MESVINILVLQVVVLLSIVVGLVLAVEVGYRLGDRRVRGSAASKAMETGAIQGAMLGLLGLLLGFSFAGASGRFMERQDLISAEANAIGTAYLRADMLDEDHTAALRSALRNYVDHRVEASKTLQYGLSKENADRIAQYHREIWEAAAAGVTVSPQYSVVVLNPVNDVIDFHSLRIAAGAKHLPGLVIGLLLMCSVITLAVIGYCCAIAKRRSTSLTMTIALLIAAALWTTIDLDRPRIGLIRLSDAALQNLNLEQWGR